MGETGFPPNDRCPSGRTGKRFADCCLVEGVKVDTLRENTITALRSEGALLEIVFAYERTGIVVFRGLRSQWSAADLDEWEDAIAEYRELHAR